MNEKEKAAGFTLIEVVAAVVIAAFSLGAIYAASIQCLKQIWMAREASRAARITDYELENLRTMPWNDIVSHGSSYAMSVSNNPALALLNQASGTVALTPVHGNSNVVKATVSVNWAGHPNSPNTNMSAAIIVSKNSFLR